MNRISDSPWSQPGTVAGFSQSPPNQTLLRFVHAERGSRTALRILDIGCGAGRNATPLAELGHEVLGIDLSFPMLRAARLRSKDQGFRLQLAMAPMDVVPAPDRCFDVVIAHGIWNLARSSAEFRTAVREAARVSKPGASLFVFTFSRNTLPEKVLPVQGETFVFTQFSGQPQCFVTGEELVSELAAVGYAPDPAVPLTEHNRPRTEELQTGGPVIYEAAFRLMA